MIQASPCLSNFISIVRVPMGSFIVQVHLGLVGPGERGSGLLAHPQRDAEGLDATDLVADDLPPS